MGLFQLFSAKFSAILFVQDVQKLWENEYTGDFFAPIYDKWVLIDSKSSDPKLVRKFELISNNQTSEVVVLKYENKDQFIQLEPGQLLKGSEVGSMSVSLGKGEWKEREISRLPDLITDLSNSVHTALCSILKAEWTFSFSVRRRTIRKSSDSSVWTEYRNGQEYEKYSLERFHSNQNVTLKSTTTGVLIDLTSHYYVNQSDREVDWSYRLGYWSIWTLSSGSSDKIDSAVPELPCTRTIELEWHDKDNQTRFVRNPLTRVWMKMEARNVTVQQEYYEYHLDSKSKKCTLVSTEAAEGGRFKRIILTQGRVLEEVGTGGRHHEILQGGWQEVMRLAIH